jgi:hypothetical protein
MYLQYDRLCLTKKIDKKLAHSPLTIILFTNALEPETVHRLRIHDQVKY